MEVKEKQEKKSRVIEFILKEHKYENLILAVLAIFAIELGVLLLTKVLEIPDGAFLIGQNDTSKIVFAWILVALGAVSLVLSVMSFYLPSVAEIKHIKGYKKLEYVANIGKVLLFVFVLVAFFLLCDFAIEKVIALLKDWLA